MNFSEMKAKTQLQVVGIVNQISTYISKDGKNYHSVDLIVKGLKNNLNVKLPDNTDLGKYPEGAMVTLPLTVSEFQGRTNISLLV